MVTLSTTTALPEGSTAFVFGSFLTAAEPADLDVLVLYDQMVCDPRFAYGTHLKFVDAVRRLVPIPVDLTLLSYMEAHECRFLDETGCVPFTGVEDRLTMRWRSMGKSADAFSRRRSATTVCRGTVDDGRMP